MASAGINTWHREATEGIHTLTDKLNRNEAVVGVVGPGYVGLPLAVTAALSVMGDE